MHSGQGEGSRFQPPDFRGFFQQFPTPCLLLRPDDPVFTVVAANRAYAEAASLRESELTGRGLLEILTSQGDAAGMEGLRESLRLALQTGTKHTMAVPQRPGFQGRYWRMVNWPQPGENGVSFLVHRLEDVTDLVAPACQDQSLHEMQEKLLAIEARYGLAFAKAPIGMVLLTPDGRILEVNQAYIDSLGYTREELVSKDSSLLTHPEDVELTRNFFVSLLEGERGTGSIEKRYFRKDGEIMWTRASATLRRDDDGKPVEVIAIVEDITERKRAEEKLWESRAQLRVVYDGTYEYMGLIAVDGTVLDCNRASLEFAGNKREDVIGMPFWETPWFAHTPGAPENLRQAIELAATGQFVRYEASLRRPSGGEITFDFSLHPVRNERGEVVFLVPEGRDITERNRAAQQIEEDRRRWRELLNQAPAGIALLRGPEHRFEWVNRDYELIVGRPAEALIGKPVVEAVPEVEGQAYLSFLNGVYNTGKPYHGHEALLQLIRTDGTLEDIYINFVYSPTRSAEGEIDGVFVHVSDVTGLVMARKRVEESERRFRQLADSMPQMVWTARPDGFIDYYNERWYEFTGFERSPEKNQSWLPVLHPEEAPLIKDLWRRSIQSGEPFQVEARMWDRRENRWRWIMGRAVSVRDEQGNVVKWFGTGTDIDEQKTSQQALLQTQKLESIGLLAGGIAHDFNNLLVGIMGGASFALETISRSHPAADMLRTVVQASERAAHLTRQMLAYAGKGNFIVAPVDLSEMVAQTMQLVSASIPKSVLVKSQLSSQAPIVEADPSQMQQVVMNLIINAAEAVGEQNGLVVVRTRRERISPGAVRLGVDGAELAPGLYTVLEVQDTGGGIAPPLLTKIFDPFFSTKFTGRGLGLAAVAGVVRSHRGAIEVDTEVGKGSTFRVLLPASQKLAPPPAELPEAEYIQRGQETILVVDDEEMVRHVAHVALTALGYRVIVTEDGEHGLAEIRRNADISLLLLDMSMPGLSGREVLEAVRQIRPELPIVICSGYSEGEVYRHFHGMEMDGILQKPFTAHGLTKLIRTILDSPAERMSRLRPS